MKSITSAEQEVYSKTILGFWVYLMTDCILFGCLFATFVVLHSSTFGGPSAADLFTLPFALTETFLLLTSSFTCGLAILAAYRNNAKQLTAWMIVALLLGVGFLAMELTEFTHLVLEGNSWKRSAFLSSYFTLVGTHGLHISFGLLWMIVLISQLWAHGLTPVILKRFTCLTMFWHFLDVVWIFIFTIVYLLGVK